jgi:hypothetical protein
VVRGKAEGPLISDSLRKSGQPIGNLSPGNIQNFLEVHANYSSQTIPVVPNALFLIRKLRDN